MIPSKKPFVNKRNTKLQGNLYIESLAFIEVFKAVQHEFEISFKFYELCQTAKSKKRREQQSIQSKHFFPVPIVPSVLLKLSFLMVSLLYLITNYCVLPFCSCPPPYFITYALTITHCLQAQLEALLSPFPVHEKQHDLVPRDGIVAGWYELNSFLEMLQALLLSQLFALTSLSCPSHTHLVLP